MQLPVMGNEVESGLRRILGSDLKTNKPLAPFTGYKTGGSARFFVEVFSSDDVVRAVKAARELSVPFVLLGGGSNLLVSDEGYDGLIIRVAISGLRLADPATIECGAGEQLTALVDYATDNGLAGLEFAAGIAGTVGGAIFGNAGAYGGEIGKVLSSVTLVDRQGVVRKAGPAECGFAYRDSDLKKTGEVIVTAQVTLVPETTEAVRRRVEDILARRKAKLPQDIDSAGCFFKNIPDREQPHGKMAAGRLLDEAGAKGMTVGAAKVSREHANIIVNTGGATSKDIDKLADLLKQRVQKRFGITLEEEVIRIGHFE
ncbi:MAG: UDP-N-acetylmuramate dehydrogenase [Candidatus Zixiibacteriota bacterium]